MEIIFSIMAQGLNIQRYFDLDTGVTYDGDLVSELKFKKEKYGKSRDSFYVALQSFQKQLYDIDKISNRILQLKKISDRMKIGISTVAA